LEDQIQETEQATEEAIEEEERLRRQFQQARLQAEVMMILLERTVTKASSAGEVAGGGNLIILLERTVTKASSAGEVAGGGNDDIIGENGYQSIFSRRGCRRR
jgi:hypothetical protein